MSFFDKNNDNFDREAAARNLYGDEMQKAKQQEWQRNELLNNLGDKFEPKHIFASNEKLEQISKNNSLKAQISTTPQLEELKNKYSSNIQAARNFENEKLKSGFRQADEKRIKNSLQSQEPSKFREDLYGNEAVEKINKDKLEKEVRDYKKLIALDKNFNSVASVVAGPDASNMLNLSFGKNPKAYLKDATKLTNVDDIRMSNFKNGEIDKFKPYIENKIKEQFKDFDYDIKDIGGCIFNSNHESVKRIKQSTDFKDMIAKNIHNIADGKTFSGRFVHENNKLFKRGDNLHNAFGSVDFLNAGYDKNGNLKLYMFDTYDFNKGENPKVEAGRRMMQEGKLKGYYSLHEITLTKDELDDIMKNTRYDKW